MKKKEENVAAKKSVKKSNKKAPAKAAQKTAKKVEKKAAPKKVTKPAKKAAKSAPKASPKKGAKKATKQAVKKTAKITAKAPAKVAAYKAPATKPAPTHDLQDFVTPLDDRLLVRLSGADKMTSGGLYIPDTVSDVSGNLNGQVVAIGRGHLNKKGFLRPMDVKIGDKVMFPEHAGSKIKIQNEDLVILREAEVMGVVSK